MIDDNTLETTDTQDELANEEVEAQFGLASLEAENSVNDNNNKPGDINPTALHASSKKQSLPPHNGEHLVFDKDGSLKERAFYENGKKHGEVRVYKNGLLSERKHYKEGILEGFVELYDNGIMKMSINYQNNTPNGIGYYFHKSGVIHAMVWYKDGLLEGPFIVFNESGLVIKRDIYMKNKLNGPSYIYYESGMIFQSGENKNNLKDGEWITKDPDGNLMQTIIYNQGAIVAKKIEKPSIKKKK